MALRLTGEEFSVVQGLDGQGWVKELASGAKLPSPQINGAVSTTGLTLPAFAAGGDISLGANLLKTTDLALKQGSTTQLRVRNAADSADRDLLAATLRASTGIAYETGSSGAPFDTGNADNAGIAFRARDSGVGLAEVARLQGAAEPRLKFTLPAQMYRNAGDYGGNFSSYTPPAGVEGDMVVAEDTNVGSPGRRIYVYSGGAWRYVALS